MPTPHLEKQAMMAGKPCKLWTEETSWTLNTRARNGLPKCIPFVQTQPAMVPIIKAPPGVTIKLQQDPIATPPANVAFFRITIGKMNSSIITQSQLPQQSRSQPSTTSLNPPVCEWCWICPLMKGMTMCQKLPDNYQPNLKRYSR